MSDTNTKIALWMVGTAAAVAIMTTLALGTARPTVDGSSVLSGAAPSAAEPDAAAARSELPPGLSLHSLVTGSVSGDPASSGMASEPVATEPPADAGAPLAQVAFDAGQSGLSAKAKALLADIASGVKAMDGAVVTLSGFHDASGSPELNAALAKERALAVRDELVAKGMPAERIRLLKPQAMLGDADPASARRVDIGLIR